MSEQLTWKDVLSKFAEIVQHHDRGEYISEVTCRKFFSEALPTDWLQEKGIRLIPKRLVMRTGRNSDHKTIDGAKVIAECIRVVLTPGHPLYLPQLEKCPKKVSIAEDTVFIQKVDGVWSAAGDQLSRNFFEDMTNAEKKLRAMYQMEFFDPAVRLARLAEELGEERLIAIYDDLISIDAFVPASAKALTIKDILAFGKKRADTRSITHT